MSSRKVNLQINVPLLHPEAKKVALEIANAPFVFEVDGHEQQFLANEVTHEMLLDAASRIAALSDENQRKLEVLQLMGSSFELVRDAQKLARHYLEIGTQLEETSKKLELLRQIVIHEMDVRRLEDSGDT